MKALTVKETAFVDALLGPAAGNASKAAELAGYSAHSARYAGYKLATKTHIQHAITERQRQQAAATIADAKERFEVLTGIIRGSESDRDRIKAIDVANKMDGIYVQKHEVTLRLTLADLLAPDVIVHS